MANIFGIQIGSKFVSTKKYENALIREKQDYERFKDFEKSELLNRYNTLNALIHSGDFEKKVNFLKTAKYKNTEQYRQLDQYNTMKKAPDIKTYLKFSKTGKLDRMNDFIKSDLYKEFNDLKQYVNSTEFHSAKVKKDFKQSEAFAKMERFKSLKKDPEIKFFLKTEKTGDYRTVVKLEKSERLQTFFKLESIVESPDFIEHKNFMEDKKRFNKSEEARLINEFKELSNNEEVKWYLHKKKTNPFKEVSKWTLTFEDDFDGLQLDKAKWMTGYYWGKALMNESYSLHGEKQFFKDDNIEMHDSIVRIITQQETVKGKMWDTMRGFTVQEFDYTSGLISTGQSFRQKYGKFEAKISFSQAYPVMNAFWMAGEKTAPQIDIVKSSVPKGKAVESGIHDVDGNNNPINKVRKINGTNFKKGFYIYTLLWTPEALIWKINGHEVNRETNNIPNEPMYISLCTILNQDPSSKMLPTQMDVDWVRCYKKKQD